MSLISKIKNHHNDVNIMRLNAERTYNKLSKAIDDTMSYVIKQHNTIQGFKPYTYLFPRYTRYLMHLEKLNKKCKRSFSKKKIAILHADMYSVYKMWECLCERAHVYTEFLK